MRTDEMRETRERLDPVEIQGVYPRVNFQRIEDFGDMAAISGEKSDRRRKAKRSLTIHLEIPFPRMPDDDWEELTEALEDENWAAALVVVDRVAAALPDHGLSRARATAIIRAAFS